MNVKSPRSSRSTTAGGAGVALVMALSWSVLHAQPDPSIRLFQVNPACGPGTQPQTPRITYGGAKGSVVGQSADPRFDGQISVKTEPPGSTHFAGNVFWTLGPGSGCAGNAGNSILTCGPFTVTKPQDPPPPADPTDPPVGVSPASSPGRIQITGNIAADAATGAGGEFSVSAAEAPDGIPDCQWNYTVHVVDSGGGWGDPHITTVDGLHYDFQSAGEFTSLRGGQFELQTRQTAVPTTSIPGPNAYTGLASCVSVYTAVAARFGKNRVTLQPRFDGEPSPTEGLQLRVNGDPVTVSPNGLNLPGEAPGRAQARIVGLEGGAYQITDADGTQLVVTPAFWPGMQRWYLNVNVYQTSASAGIMGSRAPRSWLPALPDGTSLGEMPDSTKERYQQLYEQFADAWRVTGATSLFDYAEGTNTDTFTLDEWPRYAPQSCALQGQTAAMPTTPEAAAEACKGVTDAAQRADCVFDVTFTGHTGFADSYVAMQNVRPHGTGWQPPLVGDVVSPTSPPPESTRWWLWILALIVILILVTLLVLKKKPA